MKYVVVDLHKILGSVEDTGGMKGNLDEKILNYLSKNNIPHEAFYGFLDAFFTEVEQYYEENGEKPSKKATAKIRKKLLSNLEESVKELSKQRKQEKSLEAATDDDRQWAKHKYTRRWREPGTKEWQYEYEDESGKKKKLTNVSKEDKAKIDRMIKKKHPSVLGILGKSFLKSQVVGAAVGLVGVGATLATGGALAPVAGAAAGIATTVSFWSSLFKGFKKKSDYERKFDLGSEKD